MDGINVYALFNPNAVLCETEIAKLFGITQPRMSDLIARGQFPQPFQRFQGRLRKHRWRVGDICRIVRL